MKTLKRLSINLSLLLGMLLIGLVSAQSVYFTVNDSNLNFTDTDMDTAYLNLDYTNGNFVVSLSDQPQGTRLPAIAVTVPNLDKEDFWGNTINAQLSDIAEITVLDYGTSTNGFQVTHADADVTAVATAYMKLLAQQGFTAASTQAKGNSEICIFSNGNQHLRAIFTQRGSDVTAYIYSL